MSVNTKPGTSLFRTTQSIGAVGKGNPTNAAGEALCHRQRIFAQRFGSQCGTDYHLPCATGRNVTAKEDDVNSIIGRINTLSQKIPDAQLFAAAPPMINGYGMVNGFELHVQDKTGKPVSELDDATKGFIASLSQCPEIRTAYTAFSADYPQYTLDIDAARCERSGLSPAEVLSTVSGYYGGQYVSILTVSPSSTVS